MAMQTKETKFCMHCGNRLPSNAAFCPTCGKKIDSGCGAGREVPLDSVQPEVHEQSTDAKIGSKDEAQYREDGFMFEKIFAVALFSVGCFFAFFVILKLWTSVDWERQEGQLTHNLIVTIFLLLPVSLGFSIIHRKYFKKGK